MQGHRHNPLSGSNGFVTNVGAGGAGVITAGVFARVDATTNDPVTDGTNGTPRTGPRTRPRSGIFNFYAYVGTYAA